MSPATPEPSDPIRSVADLLRDWQQAHAAAKRARLERHLNLSTAYALQAQDALSTAATLDPDRTDPDWTRLRVPALTDLEPFYAKVTDTDRPLAPRFRVGTPETEQTALKALHDRAAKVKTPTPAPPEPVSPPARGLTATRPTAQSKPQPKAKATRAPTRRRR